MLFNNLRKCKYLDNKNQMMTTEFILLEYILYSWNDLDFGCMHGYFTGIQ